MPRDPNILEVYIAHRGGLVNYANRVLKDREHAEDVVQEAYLRFDAAAGERILNEPLSYLYSIVRNLALDLQRKRVRERSRNHADGDGMIALVEEQTPSPEATTAARQELRVITEALAELPERTRIALEMHRFGSCTFKEIAKHLGVSVGTAHALVIQGLEHCRQRLIKATGSKNY